MGRKLTICGQIFSKISLRPTLTLGITPCTSFLVDPNTTLGVIELTIIEYFDDSDIFNVVIHDQVIIVLESRNIFNF